MNDVVTNFYSACEKLQKEVNQSGLQPVDFKVLVLQDTVEEVSEGGIVIAREAVQKEQWKEVRATLIAVGGDAFNDWCDPRPKPGDRVVVREYSGYKITGKDGVEYQVCNDKDISLIIEEE